MNTDDRALADLIARLTEALDFDAQAGTDAQWSRLMAEAMNARDRLEAFHAKPNDGGDFVAGPVWSDDECWTSEIQVVGGHYVVATVHGGSEAEVIARRDAVLAAMQSKPVVLEDASNAVKLVRYYKTRGLDDLGSGEIERLFEAAIVLSAALQSPPPVVHPLAPMVAIDEEIEAEHPGWMTKCATPAEYLERLAERHDELQRAADERRPDWKRDPKTQAKDWAPGSMWTTHGDIAADYRRIAKQIAAMAPPVVSGEADARKLICDSCGTEWFSTDGKCHLCRRGEMAPAPEPKPVPVVEEGRREAAIDRALIVAVEDAINEPPRSYGAEPMEVRDYRHSLYRIWSPLRDAISTPVAAQGDEVRDLWSLEQRLTDGEFFSDYDEDLRLLGVFRRHVAALKDSSHEG